jgi:hypothetical protein
MSQQNEAVLERALSLGWSTFTRAWPLLLVASLALIASMMPGVVAAQIIQFVGFAASAGGGTAETQTMFAVASMIVSWMCTVLLQWPAQAGLFAAATQASRGRVQDFRAIFAGFRRFGTVVFASLILSVVGVLVASPILVVAWDTLWPWAQTGFQTMPDLAAINIPLTLAVGAGCAVFQLWIGARLSVVLPRIVDGDQPRVGAIEAIRFSFERTRGNTLNAIGILILAGTASLLGLLMCCIGAVLVGIPLATALQAAFYRALLNDPDPPTPQPAPTWTGATPPQSPL